jgi:hypothetical protein
MAAGIKLSTILPPERKIEGSNRFGADIIRGDQDRCRRVKQDKPASRRKVDKVEKVDG